MPDLMPRDWIIAHRCTDVSGADDLARAIDANKTRENTLAEMQVRFVQGFGIETDLRGDQINSGILISHDPPVSGQSCPDLQEIFTLYRAANTGGCLALNIKDAGLQMRLKPLLDVHHIDNYFTFDGANPDVLMDGLRGINAFGRESEIEPFNAAHATQPLSNYPTIGGVWLDNFEPVFWITREIVERHFRNGKDVAIVSLELHPWGRDINLVHDFWARYRDTLRALRPLYPQRRLMICTKAARNAVHFFNS